MASLIQIISLDLCKDALMRVFAVLIVIIFISGCVPSPDENSSAPPKITELHSFYMPQKTSQYYLWHFIPHSAEKDSLYYVDYFGYSQGNTSEGYNPVSRYGYLDTLRLDSTINEAYISDSLIKIYYGRSADALTPRLIVLRDTLRIGAKWIAADDFVTSNGSHIQIKAEVSDYYSETISSGKLYKDIFLVTYISTVKGSVVPIESQYQNGSHINRYFARDIGEILEICKDSQDSLIWTNELIETRQR
jgi:hypothetical protein